MKLELLRADDAVGDLVLASANDATAPVTGRDLTFAAADLPGAITAGGGIPELLA